MKHITVYGMKPEYVGSKARPLVAGILVDDEKADNDKVTFNFADQGCDIWAFLGTGALWMPAQAVLAREGYKYDLENALYSVPLPADWQPLP